MLATWGCTTFPKPTLSLDFLGATSLDSGITFSRGSQATLFDSAGKLVYAKHNLVTWSQDFSQADWSKNSSTIVSTSVASPITSINYQKIEATVANTTVGITSIAITAATQQRTVSFFAKPLGDITRVLVVIQGADARINVNLVDGTFTTNAAATGSNVAVAGERFIVSTPTLTGATGVRLFLKRVGETDTNTPTTIAIGEGLYLIGAQMNVSNMEGGVTSSLTTYYPTTTAAYYAPRFDYNPSTLQPRGLLIEEQRTNLLLQSQDFTTTWNNSNTTDAADTTTAPDGLTTADTITETTATGSHNVNQSFTPTSGVAYAFSVFVKKGNGASARDFVQLGFPSAQFGSNSYANFDIVNGTVTLTGSGLSSASIVSVGNGWFRCVITDTATGSLATVAIVSLITSGTGANQESYTGTTDANIFLWGAQLEAGAFPTSYIPTTTTALTRNADVASMTGTNFSSWYNQTEGSFVANGVSFGGAVAGLYSASNGTSAQSVSVRLQQQFSFAQGLNRASFTYTTNSIARHGFAYKANDYAAAFNGTALTISAQPTDVPTTANVLNIGTLETGAFSLNGWVRRISYYPVRLAGSTLQALTA